MSGRWRRFDWVALLGTAGLSFHTHLVLSTYLFDDAYIHMRVAKNLVELGRPYFNPSEAVMASSSPAWTLLLAGLAWIGAGPVAIALLNAAITASGAVTFRLLLGELVQRDLHPAALWSFAIPYFSLVHHSGIGLMETPLALLVLGCGLLAFLRGRAWAFLFLTIAVFVRIECVVFLVAVLVLNLFTRRISTKASLLWSLGAALPFVTYELAWFGTLTPGTVAAKRLVYELSLGEVLGSWASGLLPPPPWGRPLFWIVPLLALGAILVVHGVGGEVRSGRIREERSWTALAILAAGLTVGLTYVAARGLIFPWYVPLHGVPPTLAVFALALRAGRTRVPYYLLAVVFLLPHGLAIARTAAASFGHPESYRYFAQNARVRKYVEIGQKLYERYPDARLLSSEIGGLGHGFRGTVIDGVGLVSPAALKHHPMEVPAERSAGFIGAIPVGFVEETRPELIVGMDIFLEAFLRSEVRRDYVQIREPIYVEQDLRIARSPILWGSRFMHTFIRRDLVQQKRGQDTN